MPVSDSVVIGSVPSAAEVVCERILSELKRRRFGSEDIFAVHLALEEAFLNAIKHGNKMDATRKIEIKYLVDSDRIEVTVTDEGEGFYPEDVPDPRYGENLYKTEGRGLFLIRSYMDVVEHNKRGNQVHMVRYKDKRPVTERQEQTDG